MRSINEIVVANDAVYLSRIGKLSDKYAETPMDDQMIDYIIETSNPDDLARRLAIEVKRWRSNQVAAIEAAKGGES